jgi:hypothetical protein
MMTQRVSEALEVCRRIVIHLRGAGRRVAEAVDKKFGGRRGAGGDFIDVRAFQLALAGELEAMRAGLESWVYRCECERERGTGLRRRRDHLELELRNRLLRLKNGLSGAFDEQTAGRLLRPVRQIAAASPALRWQAERLHETLTDPALELPPPQPGVEIDLALVAESVKGPAAALGQTLAAVADCEAAVRHARAQRDGERERLEEFSGRVERFDRALRELAEHVRHGERADRADRLVVEDRGRAAR